MELLVSKEWAKVIERLNNNKNFDDIIKDLKIEYTKPKIKPKAKVTFISSKQIQAIGR